MCSESDNVARVMLWYAPRSSSTAFTKCITAKGDVKCYFEPFTTAEFYGPNGRLAQDIVLEPDYTPESVKLWLESEQSKVFVKDAAYSIDGKYQFIPKGYRHSFLIRRPELLYKSIYRVFQGIGGDVEKNIISYLPTKTNLVQSLSDLLDYIELSIGDVCIIDSDDILANPAEMIRKYCNKMGLPYHSGLLQWEKGIPDTWVVAKSYLPREYRWYEHVIMSTSWEKQGRHSGSIDERIPKCITDLIEAEMPFYKKLQNHPKRILLGD